MAVEIPETCVGWGSSVRVGEYFEIGDLTGEVSLVSGGCPQKRLKNAVREMF
jgi:hypothetical protein